MTIWLDIFEPLWKSFTRWRSSGKTGLLKASQSAWARAYCWLTIETWMALFTRTSTTIRTITAGSSKRNSTSACALSPSFFRGDLTAIVVILPIHVTNALHVGLLPSEPAFGRESQHIGG